jgi:hypothetical protein
MKDPKEILKLMNPGFILESNISDTWSEFPIGSVLLRSNYKDELIWFGSLLKQRKLGGIPALKQDRQVVFEGSLIENIEELKERIYGKKM